jgi:glycosyltransferase involved in cell wall biosynthesis
MPQSQATSTPGGQVAGRLPELVTVVVCMLDAEPFLAEQLAALAEQDYAGRWEVLAVDNGCRDRSVEVARSFEGRLPGLSVVRTERSRNLNHARNAGAAAARGDFLAFCDADDVVAPGWLSGLARAAADTDIVSGAIDPHALNGDRIHWRRDTPLAEIPLKFGFLPGVPGGNCGMWASVARDVGWDESFSFGGSDIEFSWRAEMAGYRASFAPAVVLRARHRVSMLALARQSYAYGRSGPHLYTRFRGHGMPRSSLREARTEWAGLLRRAPGLIRARDERGYWLRAAAYRAGRIGGSMRFRVLFP